MKYLRLVMVLFLMNSCSGDLNNETEIASNDSIVNTGPKVKAIRSGKNSDSLLIHFSTDILKSLKNRDFKQLATYIDTLEGVRFSPYGYIDTIHGQKLMGKGLVDLSKDQQKISWGFYDGTGDFIKLDIRNYFRRFVYDADFLKAEKTSVNKFIGAGNSLNNLTAIYPGCDFTEFYFSGFNPEFDGKDWKTIRLVFKNYNDKLYLVAVVHDQWTI